MTQLHTDQPITGLEDSPDRLGRERFAALVGKSLLLTPDSPGIVVSLEGPWGYGKTSVINLIKKYFESLDADSQPIALGFNPWMVSGTDNLVQEFLVQLASEIGKPDRPKEAMNAARKLLSYSKIFSAMKYIPGAEPWTSIVENVIKGVGEAADSIGKLKELSIEEKKNHVVEAIKDLNCPLVVFIDDLDRLPPDEVFHMIRMIKAVADFPRIAFVLAFDPSYVQQTLERHGISNSSQYLDKIIQVRLQLPVIEQTAIEVLVKEEIKSLHAETTKAYFPENKDRLTELYQTSIKFLLNTPRDVRKLFNNIKMREPHVRGDVEFSDLFALEVLAIKAPEIYAHIRANPAAYTGTEHDYWGMEEPHKKVAKYADERKQLIDALPGHNKRHAYTLMVMLFPLLSTEEDGSRQRYLSQNGRIAAHDRLMIALKFGLPTSEVSTNLVRKFILDEHAREAIANEVSKEETLERFVELLGLAIEQMDVVNPADFINHLANISEHPLIAELDQKQRDVLAGRLYKRIWWVLKTHLQKLDSVQRVEHLLAMMGDLRKAGIAAYALDTCLRQHGHFQAGEAINADARWCTQEETAQIKNAWIATVVKPSTKDEIFSLNGAGEIFFLLYRVDVEKAKDIALSMLDHAENMDVWALAIGKSGSDSTKGRFSHIKEEFLNSIGGAEPIRAKVQQRLDSCTPITVELRAIYNSFLTGKMFYLVDNTEGDTF